jgi:phosphoglycolate phosphatase-like HAD superfamily hydrolase
MAVIEAVIFDFDGVILDSANIKTEAFLQLFDQYPQHSNAIKEYHIEHQGITRYQKFEWIYLELLQKPYDSQIKEELGNAFSKIVFEKVMDANFIPGALELLQKLQGRIPAFIASGTPDRELHKIVDERGLAKYFKEIFGSNISKEKAVETISDRYDINPSNILFVGDATTDYQAALAKGTRFAAVYSKEMDAYWEENGIEPVRNLMNLDLKLE